MPLPRGYGPERTVLTVATEFALIDLSMTNFNLQKCDETDLKECLPNITQTI